MHWPLLEDWVERLQLLLANLRLIALLPAFMWHQIQIQLLTLTLFSIKRMSGLLYHVDIVFQSLQQNITILPIYGTLRKPVESGEKQTATSELLLNWSIYKCESRAHGQKKVMEDGRLFHLVKGR